MTELVLRQDRDGLAVLTLNRPDKLNALNVEVFEALDAHCEQLARETDAIGLVMLRGAGKCFSAGHDLRDIGAGKESSERVAFEGKVVEKLANLPQPVITAVHGHCYTGALELALAGDVIIASESARFADTHAKWALTPVWGLSQRLPRRIGRARAHTMMMTCETLTGRQALEIGLADRCFADDEYDDALRAFSETVLANSWHSLRANKALLIETDGMPLAAGLAHEVYRTRGRGPDMHERVSAFTNRRKS